MAIYWCSNASGQRTRSNIAHTKNMFYSEASIPVRATPKCEKNHRQFVSSSRILCVTCDTPAAMSGRAGEEKITRKWRNLEMMNVLSSFYTKSLVHRTAAFARWKDHQLWSQPPSTLLPPLLPTLTQPGMSRLRGARAGRRRKDWMRRKDSQCACLGYKALI